MSGPPLDELLFGLSGSAFTARWNAVFQALGVPTREADRGVTPGCLRGSGATFLYQTTEDIPLIRWRGRWRRAQTLEVYLQEAAAFMLLAAVTPENRQRIAELASLAEAAVWSVIEQLSSPCSGCAVSSAPAHPPGPTAQWQPGIGRAWVSAAASADFLAMAILFGAEPGAALPPERASLTAVPVVGSAAA